MKKFDVIVVGAGSSGVIAAIASARMGAKTCLIEERGVFGGTNTTALVGPITPFLGENHVQIVDGIPQEIISDLEKVGGAIGHVKDPIDFCYGLTPVDFKSLQVIQANKIMNEDNIDIILHSSVVDVVREDRVINKVIVQNQLGEKNELEATVYIDATGDADVAYLAKAQLNVGRESDNLSQPMTMCFNLANVDLNVVRDDVAKNPNNFAVSDEIAKGKRMDYVAISGYFDEVQNAEDFPIDRDRLLFFQGVREDEVGVNTTRIMNKSSLNAKELIEAELEGQRQVLELYEWMRNNIPAFKDSYIKDVGVIGVRESRHLVGRKTLVAIDVLSGAKQDKSIAVGSYPIDIHSPDSSEMEFIEDQELRNFEIDLEMLMPIEIDNLLVAGRPISATHDAHAASRVSATCMAIGQSAGIVAAMAAKNNTLIEDLDYKHIKENILAFKGIVDR